MSIRSEVKEFVAMGPLPSSDVAQEKDIEIRGALLDRIQPPVTQDEADALAKCFGPDECFGLGWTLLHLIESAPRLPHIDKSTIRGNEWLTLVWAPRGAR